MNTVSENYMEIFDALDFNQIKDHPNILIAANFWDSDRYDAAKVCYKLMRTIDDLIDNYKASHKVISEDEKGPFTTEVEDWIGSIVHKTKNDPKQKELFETFERFKIPVGPMEAFARSMIYDIHHDGFANLQTFLDYAEGASVAPAAIFVHLSGVTLKGGQYDLPSFDVMDAARPCAIFSYLVHIIRDFQKDQFNNLNYLADDLVEKNGLDRKQLNEIAHGGVIKDGFRNLIREYCVVADEYRLKTYKVIQKIRPFLEPRYRLSLELIFNLYLMVYERIDVENGCFTAEELNPTPEEIKQRVYDTIQEFIMKKGVCLEF